MYILTVLTPIFMLLRCSQSWERNFYSIPNTGKNISNYLFGPEKDPCLGMFCGRGMECIIATTGLPNCSCLRECKKRYHPVCGSDGQLYLNHCELHRNACIENRIITVDKMHMCHWDKGKATMEKHVNFNMIDYTNDLNPAPSSSCSAEEYEVMKDNLILYNHQKLTDRSTAGKEYLVSIMFSHYDQNNNGALEEEELVEASNKEKLSNLAQGCGLPDLLTYDDSDHDGKMNINEFYSAFSKLYSVSVVSLDKALEVNRVSALVEDNVEIKCDVTGSPKPPIVWRRNGVDLSSIIEDNIQIFNDGSLYLTRVQLIHAGNYTCHAQRNRDVVQTHILRVHTSPKVQATPHLQSLRPGEQANMQCHVTGEPQPNVQWLKNDEALHIELPNKFVIRGNGTYLSIFNLDYADTGAYMCQATNIGGLSRSISSLVIQDTPIPSVEVGEKKFFVFHDKGISVYEPKSCHLNHQIMGTDVIPGTQQHVCGDKAVRCAWGKAINVANTYIYISQPTKDRILVISKVQMVVVDVIVTDRNPNHLSYVPHFDQVWVLNWRGDEDEGRKTIQIIRDASQKRKHHTVHPEPIQSHFDLVNNLFIPPTQEFGYNFAYGYVTHTNQRGLYKLNLTQMKYSKNVDLTPYNCVPQSLEFISLYGFIVIECAEPITRKPTGQILMDYLTDTVLSHKTSLYGTPLVSPDSRTVVTLDRQLESVTLIVESVTSQGLHFAFDVKTTLNISDIEFYPSQTSHSYDLYATAVQRPDILYLNIHTGKVEMITGVGPAIEFSLAEFGNVNRPIVAAGVFAPFMVTTAKEAAFVINGISRTVNCEIAGLLHPRLIVWSAMD